MQQKISTRSAGKPREIGHELHALVTEIYPICRSITGDGVRRTLEILSRCAPITRHEVASGTPVFDWTVPREWNIRDAWIKNAAGERVVDFRKSNLHVMSYSVPIHTRMTREALSSHVFTLPDQPDLIPYRTSYYHERWGFCMSHNAFLALPEGEYEVGIDSTLEDGFLTYGEYVHPGETDDEILLTAHICHPSLADDNCSGLAVLARLAAEISRRSTRHTFRFLFAPGTIGAITWLATHQETAPRIKHGLVVSCIGDRGGWHYKRSRHGNAMVDRAVVHTMQARKIPAHILDFEPYGYDERQYCSPGFNLPVGLFQRSKFGAFPEYHTSADNLDFVTAEDLARSYEVIVAAIDTIERNRTLRNLSPFCEPQLGRRGLFTALGGDKNGPATSMAMLWVLNLSDGRHSLLDIAERAQMPFDDIAAAAELLETHGLLGQTDAKPASEYT